MSAADPVGPLAESEHDRAVLRAVAEHLKNFRNARLANSYQPPSFHAGIMAGLEMARNEVRRLADGGGA